MDTHRVDEDCAPEISLYALEGNAVSVKRKWKGFERRRFPRINVSVPINCRILTNISIGDFKVLENRIYQGRTRNVSLKGLCIKTDKQIPADTIVEIKIDFPEQQVKAVGRVIWSKEIKKSGEYYTGVELVIIPENQINAMVQSIVEFILNSIELKRSRMESTLHEILLHMFRVRLMMGEEDAEEYFKVKRVEKTGKSKCEKRVFPRINVRIPVKYRIFPGLSSLDFEALEGTVFKTYTRNISSCGLCIKTDKILPPHTMLELIIEFHKQPIQALGKVIWSHELEEPGRIYTGAEYTAMADDQVAAMTQSIVEILVDKYQVKKKIEGSPLRDLLIHLFSKK